VDGKGLPEKMVPPQSLQETALSRLALEQRMQFFMVDNIPL
jgi:hypothetical protein